jgi:ADP-ribose pyrophosphatase YjhB (NUDIX family)
MNPTPPKSPHWLPEAEWRKVQSCLPIACVDVLPFRRESGGALEIGLIRRGTPHQGRRWCLIGGRLQFGETLAEAAGREIAEALGGGVGYSLLGDGQPFTVVQYLPVEGQGQYFDPRQHAVSLTYAAELSGTPSPQGEALDFRWFAVAGLPGPDSIGFGQRPLIVECCERLAAAR